MTGEIRYTVRFSGRVQGVFFRATAREIASRHAVQGWVRNEPDGTVLCVVEGAPAEVDRFVAAVRAARHDNIDDVEIERSEAEGSWRGFSVV